MRSPRYVPPQKPHKPSGPILAMPADSHEVFERERREALSRASQVTIVDASKRGPSTYGHLFEPSINRAFDASFGEPNQQFGQRVTPC